MVYEMGERITLGWSREHLAQISGVQVAAIYLLERLGSAGPEDDQRIRDAIADGLAEQAYRAKRRA